MINSHWLELPRSRTNFHGPKDVEPLKFDCIYNNADYKHCLHLEKLIFQQLDAHIKQDAKTVSLKTILVKESGKNFVSLTVSTLS